MVLVIPVSLLLVVLGQALNNKKPHKKSEVSLTLIK
jgi:hypothetical protein